MLAVKVVIQVNASRQNIGAQSVLDVKIVAALKAE